MGNIPSLEQFDDETLAEVAPVNNNFEALRVAVNDNDGRITSLKNETSYNIQNLNSTIQTIKNELIDEIGTMVDPDLSNVTQTGIEKILNYIKPNMSSSSAINISSGFTATADGWVEIYTRAYSNRSFSIKINGKVFVSLSTDAGLNGASWQGFVWKGDKVEFSGESITSYFRPMKSTFK